MKVSLSLGSILLLCLGCCILIAQSPTDIIQKQLAVDLQGNMGSVSTGNYTGNYTFDNRYEGVRGSRWLYSA